MLMRFCANCGVWERYLKKMIHDKEYFYKYLTAETALKILQNRTLKYSSPVTFNDPFDSQTRMDFDFEMSEFNYIFSDELYRLIHNEREPVGDDSNTLFKDIKKVDKHFGALIKEELGKSLTELYRTEYNRMNWMIHGSAFVDFQIK